MRRSPARRCALSGVWLAVAMALAACAPVQVVPLRVEPAGAEIFVDGRALPPGARQVELRADRDHTLFVKSQGYQSELIVLRAAGAALDPGSIDVRLERRVPRGAEIRIESEPE